MAPSQLGAFARSSAGLRDRQSRVPLPAAVARQMGRAACTPSAPSRRASAICGPSSRGSVHLASADPAAPPAIRAELPLDRRGPARRGRGAAPYPPHRRRRRRSRSYRPQEHRPGAQPRLGRRAAPGGGRDRHDDLPPGRHGQDGARERSAWRCSTSACGCAGSRACGSSTPRRCRASPPATPTRRR